MTDLLPLGSLGAVEAAGTVAFGLWLPWVSAADGNSVSVKIIHEADQFLQQVMLTIPSHYGRIWTRVEA